MERVLGDLKPQRVFYYFEEISNIPRCSKDEESISNYLVELGKNLGLETIQDQALNVIIKKPGTKGYENSPTIVLQGHMDMVCEKDQLSNHDFSKDPLKLIIDGDYIRADSTTLGADNGIAIAMSLAVLESNDIPHPPLEVLCTSDEETGMTGAHNLDPNDISGKMLINIDSEEEGIALVGCAGGERNQATIPLEWDSLDNEYNLVYNIVAKGLLGGHSGMEIHKERGNANKIIARTLEFVKDKCNLKVALIEGGSKANAIPKNGLAKVVIRKEDKELFLNAVNSIEEIIQSELSIVEADFQLSLEELDEKIDKVFSQDSYKKVIAALMLIPTGVQSMSMAIEGLVESSNNMAIVETKEDSLLITSTLRSAKGSLKEYIGQEIKILLDALGGSAKSYDAYPAWEFKNESELRQVFKKVYKEEFGEELAVSAIHAGLECGLFDEKFGGTMDMISFGPDMEDVHTTNERVSISSVERTYQFLLAVLKEIK